MNDTEFRMTLAKLQAAMATRKAQILANPEPYLRKLEEHSVRLLKVLDRIDYALSPDVIFDTAMAMEIDPDYFEGKASLQLMKARQILSDYRSKKNV